MLIALGMFGASLFYGDGMITPAISVLSAVEGLKVVAPGLDSMVRAGHDRGAAALFVDPALRHRAVGRVFGPVMVVWFAVIAVAGLGRVVAAPRDHQGAVAQLRGRVLRRPPGIAFIALGSVVLTITGAEALYADMGHFGRPPIRRAWFFVVFPALTLNYLGQGSLILRPRRDRQPVLPADPALGALPMVVLATVATVIASQAVISGAFSVTRQAMQLGFLPRLTIRHTSAQRWPGLRAGGQLGLFVAVVGLVLGFGSSTELGFGLRDSRHRDDHGRHDPVPGRRAPVWRTPPGAGRARRGRVPDHRGGVLRLHPAPRSSTVGGSRS